MSNLLSFFEFFIKFSFLYSFLFLIGRSFTILFHNAIKEKEIPNFILSTKKAILFPIIGLAVLGNFLILFNFLLPLDSIFIKIILLIFILINLTDLKFEYKKVLNIKNILYYTIIPSVLIFSTFNIFFHYDAGYYHLNHQNWLRESNIILGFVNIFWAFGMSSISEYISAFFWIEDNLLSLHFINLIYISFWYLFIADNLLYTKFKSLKNVSFFMIIYSLLDNFGFQGGRNGFIYIEGVGKQDVATGILFFYISVIGIYIILNRLKLTHFEITVYSLFVLFTIQLKLNAVIIFILYLAVMYIQFKEKIKFKSILIYQLTTIFFSFMWILKTYLTTGCLIFPLSLTCYNNFDWYLPGSTQQFELISKQSSLNYEVGSNFLIWLEKYTSYEFYNALLLNFGISLIILIIIKFFIFNKKIKANSYRNFILIYFLMNFLYLLTFGPIPRYSIGILMTVIASIGLFSGNMKFKLNKVISFSLIIFSCLLIVRFDSYRSFLSNEDLILFDPRPIAKYVEFNDSWVIPDEGDQCWINLECTMNKDDIVIYNEGLFKFAYKY